MIPTVERPSPIEPKMNTPLKVPLLLADSLRLVTWHKHDGEEVHRDEPLAEIRLEGTTGQVDCDVVLPAPATGRLKVLVHCGAIVVAGQKLGSID